MKPVLSLCLALIMLTGLFSSCATTYYVRERPVEPVYVRPASPYPGAYWVPGEYVWRGRAYVYVNGYWARPHAGRRYIRGYWETTPRGYVWHRGYWQ